MVETWRQTMRIVREIVGSEVRAGDIVRDVRTIRRGLGRTYRAKNDAGGVVCLLDAEGEREYPGAEDPLELLQRPYSGGHTKVSMLAGVHIALRVTVENIMRADREGGDRDAELEKMIPIIQEALDAFDLGKPFDTAQGKPPAE